MSNVVTESDIGHLLELVADYRERTGETVSAFAKRAGVERTMLSQFLAGTYRHSPQFEFVSKVARAIGKRIDFADA